LISLPHKSDGPEYAVIAEHDIGLNPFRTALLIHRQSENTERRARQFDSNQAAPIERSPTVVGSHWQKFSGDFVLDRSSVGQAIRLSAFLDFNHRRRRLRDGHCFRRRRWWRYDKWRRKLEQQDRSGDRSGGGNREPSAAMPDRGRLPTESGAQFLFDARRRLLLHRRGGQGKQPFGEPLLRGEPAAAWPALSHVSQRAITGFHLEPAVSRQIDNHRFYFLAIHTKALFRAFSLSSNMARARCRRERTVPNAHPSTAAAFT
jgi:hypothetical protein